jgi:hypothetical protein
LGDQAPVGAIDFGLIVDATVIIYGAVVTRCQSTAFSAASRLFDLARPEQKG